MRLTPVWTVGIVGCGRIAGIRHRPSRTGPILSHAQAYARDSRFRLRAAVDPSKDALAAFQQTWDVAAGYASLPEMLDHETLDVVSLCSPTAWHATQALEILSMPQPPRVLLLEKPVCRTSQELSMLREMVPHTSTTIVVNHTRRFDPAHQQMADLIRSGALGRLRAGRYTYYGGWLNNGTHLIDTLRMLLPGRLEIVAAEAAPGGRPGDDNLVVRCCSGDATIVFEPVEETDYVVFECDLRFENGRVQLLEAGASILVHRVMVNELDERVLARDEQYSQPGLRDPLARTIDVVSACLDGDDPSASIGVDFSTAAETMALVWRAQALVRRPRRPHAMRAHASRA